MIVYYISGGSLLFISFIIWIIISIINPFGFGNYSNTWIGTSFSLLVISLILGLVIFFTIQPDDEFMNIFMGLLILVSMLSGPSLSFYFYKTDSALVKAQRQEGPEAVAKGFIKTRISLSGDVRPPQRWYVLPDKRRHLDTFILKWSDQLIKGTMRPGPISIKNVSIIEQQPHNARFEVQGEYKARSWVFLVRKDILHHFSVDIELKEHKKEWYVDQISCLRDKNVDCHEFSACTCNR